jgi:hypothetical protein
MDPVFFISLIISSTCFGCYLHPSSGAQLQRTAIGFVWFGVLLRWGRDWFGTALQFSTVSYPLQCNNTPNHTKLMAVRCSCAPDDGCKSHETRRAKLSCRTAAIQERVIAVLLSIPKEAFADSFQKLYERCQPCVVKYGDYFEGQ